jgi:cell division septation protein DedD
METKLYKRISIMITALLFIFFSFTYLAIGLVLKSEAVENKKETEEKSSQLHKPSKDIFTVQVGAFKEASYAKALATRLYEKGYKVYVTYDEMLFKVCIGKFSDREKADSLSEKIKKTEGLQAVVTLSYD